MSYQYANKSYSTGLDLREQERYWQYVREGRANEYHGIAIHPRHLSLYERMVLKRHLAYNPELDRKARMKEWRVLHEAISGRKGKEEVGPHGQETLSDNISTYFEWESMKGSAHRADSDTTVT